MWIATDTYTLCVYERLQIMLISGHVARIGRCATLIGYPSMFFVNTLYVGHLIVEFCICILKAMTNYQPQQYSIVCCHWLCYMAKDQMMKTAMCLYWSLHSCRYQFSYDESFVVWKIEIRAQQKGSK
jgi:hypothetical protein